MAEKPTVRQGLKNPQRRELLSLERHVVAASTSGGEVHVHLAYPNQYWVAMSNLGFQAVYRIFAQHTGFSVERGFLPEDHAESEIRKGSWRTFEHNRLLGDCDVLAFSLSFETDYPHLVGMLANAGLLNPDAEARAKEADESKFGRPLILAGGTGITLNPEPVADLIDVMVIGEAEGLLEEINAIILDAKRTRLTRTELLVRLAQLEGVYVPRFYRPRYNEDGTIDGWHIDERVPARPKRHFVKDLSKYPAYSSILTPETEFKDMFLTETGRGCEMGCRFCVAGYIYRPVRKRNEESLTKSVEVGLENSKAVGFVGASVSSHRSIAKLAATVAEKGARASLSSIMSQKVTRELAGSISESEYKTVALAPEAGTERLRRAAGKRVANEQVIEAAAELAEAGIRGFKLYFIVGLPTETEEDVDAIAALATQVRDRVVEISKPTGRVAWVSLSVNPFIPKACTPFQWEPILDRKLLDQKIERLRKAIRKVPNLELRFESPKESYFQALLSRGDRRVVRMLLEAERQAQDWKWLLKQSEKAWLEGVPQLDFYAGRRIPFDELLPWEVVDSRIDKRLLRREALRAHFGESYREEGDEEEAALPDSPELIQTALLG